MKRSRKSRVAVLAGAAVLVCAGVAFAGMSLRQKEYAQSEEKDFNEHLAQANEACGSKITAKIDWESFKGEIDKVLDGHEDKKKINFGLCAEPIKQIRWMCERPEAKGAVQKRIKSYSCKFGGKGKRKIGLKGSHLSLSVDWDIGLYDDYAKEYLGKVL